jgi:DNA-binding NtrC family response regulator
MNELFMIDAKIPYRILIVDDEASVRKAIKWMLYSSEYQVVECENAIQAKEILIAKDHFDVVISDINMPHMNGLELLKYIKKNHFSEVVMLTGEKSIDSVLEAMKSGAFDYLTKPLDAVQECILRIQQAAEVSRLKLANQHLQSRSVYSIETKEGLVESPPTHSKELTPSIISHTKDLTEDDINLTKFLQKNINLSLSFQDSITPLEESIRRYYLSNILSKSKSISEAARKAQIERSNFKRLLKRYKVDF